MSSASSETLSDTLPTYQQKLIYTGSSTAMLEARSSTRRHIQHSCRKIQVTVYKGHKRVVFGAKYFFPNYQSSVYDERCRLRLCLIDTSAYIRRAGSRGQRMHDS